MPGPTLAEQLAAIRDDAPAEFDPESSAFSSGFSRSDATRDLDAGRADYVDVGPSKLRKNLANDLGDKYSGVKASRKDLYSVGQDGEDDEDEDEVESEEEDEDEERSGSAGSDVNEDSQVSEEQRSDDSGDSSVSDGEEYDDDDKDSDVAASAAKKGSASDAHPRVFRTAIDADSRQLLQDLKKASSADVEKGRHVRRQLGFWDTLLEARIRLQKCITSANTFPSLPQSEMYGETAPAEHRRAIESLEGLSDVLFSLRTQLQERNDRLSVPDGVSGRKRKRGSFTFVQESMDDLAELEDVCAPHYKAVITKWSDKVSAASSVGQQNKFKAIGAQNTWTQIENILHSDMSRLSERTKIRRGQGGKPVKVIGRDSVHEPVEGEKDVDPEVFDDTDFYQALLREVVDSGSSSATNGNNVSGVGPSYANFNNTSKKKASGVLDPKASKGRKLRYHVHEKLLNFMPPIPTESWEKEQTDELFRGLLGGVSDANNEDEDRMNGLDSSGLMSGDAGQLRIF